MTVEVRDDHGLVVETQPLWRKRRYLLVLMTFFGYFNVYTLRINLSVGIVAMTENRTIEHPDGSITYEQAFDWDSKQQGLVLSSFFYGYICTQMIGGFLANKYGGSVVRVSNDQLNIKIKMFSILGSWFKRIFNIGVDTFLTISSSRRCRNFGCLESFNGELFSVNLLSIIKH